MTGADDLREIERLRAALREVVDLADQGHPVSYGRNHASDVLNATPLNLQEEGDLVVALEAIDEVMAADKGFTEEEWIEWCNRLLPLLQRHGYATYTLGFS